MLYIVYPKDPTTTFLLKIPEILKERLGNNSFQLIEVEPTEKSYEESVHIILDLPEESMILFMGHGQDTCLLGAESDEFYKRPLVDAKSIKIFSNKYLFSLSCYSNEFLRSTFRYSNIIKSVGFGLLPSEMSEVDREKKLSNKGVDDEVLDAYKDILVNLVAKTFCDVFERGLPFIEVSNFFLLRLNKKIIDVVSSNKGKGRILSDLLFQLKTEMIVI